MEIKRHIFSTLVLEFFCQSKFSCKKLKIQKIQKSTSPITHTEIGRILCHPVVGRSLKDCLGLEVSQSKKGQSTNFYVKLASTFFAEHDPSLREPCDETRWVETQREGSHLCPKAGVETCIACNSQTPP
jgi:hypothetical protein